MTDNGPLPNTNPNEDLETISRHKFCLALDIKRFEPRAEERRDKGVDFLVELKSTDKYLNYRFSVQLKSTASPSRNNDGSISFPIELSNLNYLLCYPTIAYYVLYDHEQDTFYYEHAWEAYRQLRVKYGNQPLPKTFNIRFHKPLDGEALSEIYEMNLQNGAILQQLHPLLGQTKNGQKKSDIIIDADNNVYSVEDIYAYLNQFGNYLINMAAFDLIIEMEQRCRPRKNASTHFNLICGIAYYQRGDRMYEALTLLTKAHKGITELQPEMATYLKFIILDSRKQTNNVSQEEYEEELDQLLENDGIGPFMEIEKAWRKCQNSEGEIESKLKMLRSELQQIADNDTVDPRICSFAYMRIHDIETGLSIYELTKLVHQAICANDRDKFVLIRKEWAILSSKFNKRVTDLHEFTMATGNLQMAGNIALSRIRLDYEPAYIFAFYDHWDAITRSSKPEVSAADRAVLNNHCGFLLASARPLELASQYQILMQSLFLRYQLLALLEEGDAMAITEKIIRDTLERHGLEALAEEFEDLLNNGMYHEHLFWDSQQRIIQAYEIAEQTDSETIETKTPKDHNPLEGIVTKWSIEEPYPFRFPPISSYQTGPPQ